MIQGAVWPREEGVRYVRLPGVTSGHYLTPAPLEEDPAVTPANAVTPASLLERSSSAAIVDYAKVDIEGSESALLREATAWADRVRTLKVEVHHPYTIEECELDLRALGYETRRDARHAAAVIGVRLR